MTPRIDPLTERHYPRDLVGYGRTPPHADWPGNARVAVQFVLNYEEGGEKKKEPGLPRVSLFSRDRVQREADLQGHLVNTVNQETPPVYHLRYLAPLPDEDDGAQKTDRRDPKKDFQIMFARDVLLASHGGRRADVLRDAATVVNSRAKQEATKVEGAFKERVGIDWSACANPANPKVKLDVSVGDDGVLDAGKFEVVRLTLTNQETRPLCQVAGVVRSEIGRAHV